MKRILCLLIALLMLSAIIAGCGAKTASPTDNANTTAPGSTVAGAATTAPSEPALKGSIVFSTHRTDKVDALQALIDEFVKLHPGVKIELEPLKDTEELLKTRAATNALTDITPLASTFTQTDYPKFFLPIDDLGFNKDNIYFYDYGTGIPDGKFYAITNTINYAGGIVYNKKVFADAGITKVPTTVDELYADCEKIKAMGVVPFASNFKDQWPLGDWYNDPGIVFLGNANYKNDLAKKDDFLSNDGGFVYMFDILKNLKDKGYLEPDLSSTSWDGFRKDFPAGKFGMTALGSWYPPQFVDMGGKPEDVGYFPFPGAKYVILGNDQLYAISKDTQNPVLAKAFFKWIMEDDRQAKALGVLSPLKGATYDAPYIKEFTSFNLPIIEAVPDTEFFDVANKAQITMETLIQEYIMSKTPADVIAKYNKKWADARKALGK